MRVDGQHAAVNGLQQHVGHQRRREIGEAEAHRRARRDQQKSEDGDESDRIEGDAEGRQIVDARRVSDG